MSYIEREVNYEEFRCVHCLEPISENQFNASVPEPTDDDFSDEYVNDEQYPFIARTWNGECVECRENK
jgi:hypothetical protein